MDENLEREIDRYKRDKWYENIWYHYKWPIIAVLAFALLLFIVIRDSYKKDPVDMYLYYITEDPAIYAEKIEALKKSISPYVVDINNDGKIVLQIKNLYVGDNYPRDMVEKNKSDFRTIMWSGTNMFFIADDKGIEFLLSEDNGKGILESLTDIEAESKLLHNGRVWQANGTPFMDVESMKSWDTNLYFGLRCYTGTVAALQSNSAASFEQAHSTLKNMIKGEQLYN